MLHLLRKIIKYGTIGTAIGGTAYMLQRNDWDVSSIGAVRFGRAAFTVSLVMKLRCNLKIYEDKQVFHQFNH